jgi:uncharacterized protein YecT (DUF1311 family)
MTMRPWSRALAATLLSTLALGAAAQAKDDPCQAVTASEQVRACALQTRQRAEAGLNAAYAATRQRIASTYRSQPALGKQFGAALLKAQRAWLAFRDSQCELAAFDAETDTLAHATLVDNCVARIDNARQQDLASLLAE